MRVSVVTRRARRAKSVFRDHPDRVLVGAGLLVVFLDSALSSPSTPVPKSAPPSRVVSHRTQADQQRSLFHRDAPVERAEEPKPTPAQTWERPGPDEHEEAPAARDVAERAPPPRARELPAPEPVARTTEEESFPEARRFVAEYVSAPLASASAWATLFPDAPAAEAAPAEYAGYAPSAAEADDRAAPGPQSALAAAPLGTPRSPNAFAPLTHPGGPVGPGGLVATFSVPSDAEGSLYLSSTFEIRVANWHAAGGATCEVASLLSASPRFVECAPGESCRMLGHAASTLRASLPTPTSTGSPLRAWQTVSVVLPLHPGLNTYHLLGRTDCPQAIWGPVSLRGLRLD